MTDLRGRTGAARSGYALMIGVLTFAVCLVAIVVAVFFVQAGWATTSQAAAGGSGQVRTTSAEDTGESGEAASASGSSSETAQSSDTRSPGTSDASGASTKDEGKTSAQPEKSEQSDSSQAKQSDTAATAGDKAGSASTAPLAAWHGLTAANVQAPALEKREPRYEPGVILSFTPKGADEPADYRRARLVSLFNVAGEPVTPFVEPGPGTITWRGYINVELQDEYTFSAEGKGEFKLTINSEVVLENDGGKLQEMEAQTVSLEKGRNAFTVTYQAPKGEAAAVQLIWASEQFRPEPVPLSVLTHNANFLPLRRAKRLRVGRFLLATRRCLNCHQPDTPFTEAEEAMPELKMDAPTLTHAGERFSRKWMAHWILNPHEIKPTTVMPAVLDDTKKLSAKQQAWDIAAYLATLEDGKPEQKINLTDKQLLAKGGHLYFQLGCNTCHALPGQDPQIVEPTRLTFKFLSVKWEPTALKQFLLEPNRHYAWTRMPDFRLSDAEAEALTVFLLTRESEGELSGPGKINPNPQRGKKLLQTQGCLSCHEVKGLEDKSQAPSLVQLLKSDWREGCLIGKEGDRNDAPDFTLNAEQRAALRAFAHDSWPSLARRSEAEFVERQIDVLRCIACHERDAEGPLWDEVKFEKQAILAQLPELENGAEIAGPRALDRPSLTTVGGKLKPEWVRAFITGKLDYTPRPWLPARMPIYDTRGKLLSIGLAAQHGIPPEIPPYPQPDPELAKIGKRLVGLRGFACITCHGIGEQEPMAVFEAPGINFQYVRARLLKDYYMRWVLYPQRVDPNTRMPKYANEELKTPEKVFDHNAVKQFQAIWQYLLNGRDIKPPDSFNVQ